MSKEKEDLKKKSNEHNDIVLNFKNGQKNLEKLLSSQKCVFDKNEALVISQTWNNNFYKNYFIKATSINDR